MDSSGHVHMFDDLRPSQPGVRPQHSGFVTKAPMPEWCDARRVLTALDRLASEKLPIPLGHPALAPLVFVERGYVLGVLAEYHAWKVEQGG